MIVELIVNRGWQVLVDGKKPESPWNAPDENGYLNPLIRVKDRAGDVVITKITMMAQSGAVVRFEDDWDPEFKPDWVILNVDEQFKLYKVTHLVYGHPENPTELLITTLDGERHDIDEITTYIRAES